MFKNHRADPLPEGWRGRKSAKIAGNAGEGYLKWHRLRLTRLRLGRCPPAPSAARVSSESVCRAAMEDRSTTARSFAEGTEHDAVLLECCQIKTIPEAFQTVRHKTRHSASCQRAPRRGNAVFYSSIKFQSQETRFATCVRIPPCELGVDSPKSASSGKLKVRTKLRKRARSAGIFARPLSSFSELYRNAEGPASGYKRR